MSQWNSTNYEKILKIDKGNIRNLEILKYWILYYHTKTKWRSLCMLEPGIVATLTLHLYNSQIKLFPEIYLFLLCPFKMSKLMLNWRLKNILCVWFSCFMYRLGFKITCHIDSCNRAIKDKLKLNRCQLINATMVSLFELL